MADPDYRVCEKSKIKRWKPERSHFCSISEKLVPRLDHYCPFVLCTIGFHNHSMFFWLCFYHTIGISLGLGGFFKWVYSDYLPLMRSFRILKAVGISAFLLTDLAIILSLLSFTTYMLFYSIKFVVENRTTIDWYEEKENILLKDGSIARGFIRSRVG